jgi:RNA polymerase sigma-B factor
LPADEVAPDARKEKDAAAKVRFARYRESGDRNLRNQLIEDHRWVAVHCARRFNNRGEPLDDLIQVAQLGLLKAVERFDPAVGVSFASFAIPTVLGELRRHFRDKTWSVKVPRRVKDLHVELAPAIDQLSGDLGRTPRPHELAEHLGVDVDAVLEALDAGAAYRTSPLASPGSAEAGTESRSEDARLKVDDSDLLGADDRMMIRSLLERLPPRERRILELRFYQEMSQSEIAAEVGVSQVHVSRLLRSSLALLQRQLDSKQLEDQDE